MTKRETFDKAMEICGNHGASEELVRELTELLEPKSGGAKVNVEEVFNKDENLLQCSVSGVWLPATKEFFYEDKTGKSPFNGLRRLSRQAEGIRKKFDKTLRTSKNAIMADILDGVISPEEGKAKIEELQATKPDYSTVTAELPEETE